MTEPERAFWGWVWLGRLWQDVQYGCRMLTASPGFASIAVLSLAIGIGANCAIFSFADALLLRPLPVARPDEVFTVGSMATVEAFGSTLRTCSTASRWFSSASNDWTAAPVTRSVIGPRGKSSNVAR